MMKSKIILGTFSVLTILLATAVILMWTGQPKVGYVNLKQVYEDFELKKELDGKLIDVQTSRQYILDSLKIELTSMNTALQKPGATDVEKQLFWDKRDEYLRLEQEFTSDNERLTRQYVETIWKRINEYATGYGKEHGYKLMIGGDGTGAVMFSSEDLDVTQDFLVYANANYKGE
jgi:Skp family chaperone for outer membrane proteins